jgi:hypothetical protein
MGHPSVSRRHRHPTAAHAWVLESDLLVRSKLEPGIVKRWTDPFLTTLAFDWHPGWDGWNIEQLTPASIRCSCYLESGLTHGVMRNWHIVISQRWPLPVPGVLTASTRKRKQGYPGVHTDTPGSEHSWGHDVGKTGPGGIYHYRQSLT